MVKIIIIWKYILANALCKTNLSNPVNADVCLHAVEAKNLEKFWPLECTYPATICPFF